MEPKELRHKSCGVLDCILIIKQVILAVLKGSKVNKFQRLTKCILVPVRS